MATKEDRYPKEYKPFPNDKPISSSQGSSSMSSSSGTGSSSGKQQPDFRDALKNTVSRHMKGFRATNVITYKRFRDKSTWQRPGEFAELVATDDEDAFTADPKEAWPIMQDMNIDIPVRELTKQHRVVDRNWTVPVSNKKFKQPEPIYPQSTGVKLRNVEDIMNDYSKKAPPQAASSAPSLSLSASSNASKSLTPATNSIPRVADKSQRPLQLIPDKIKGVLQNLTDTRRKPSSSASTTPAKSHSSTPSSSTPRKPSALKSSTITPQDAKIKKQSAPSTTTAAKSANTQSRPRVSSKTIPMEKVTQIENIPVSKKEGKKTKNQIELSMVSGSYGGSQIPHWPWRSWISKLVQFARVSRHVLAWRSLLVIQGHGSRMPKNAQVKERPRLYIRLYPKPDENDMPKGLKQHIASVNNIKVKQERAASAPSAKSKYCTAMLQQGPCVLIPAIWQKPKQKLQRTPKVQHPTAPPNLHHYRPRIHQQNLPANLISKRNRRAIKARRQYVHLPPLQKANHPPTPKQKERRRRKRRLLLPNLKSKHTLVLCLLNSWDPQRSPNATTASTSHHFHRMIPS